MHFEELRSIYFHSTEHSKEQIAWMEKVFQIAMNYLFETPRKKIHSELVLPDLETIFSETDFPHLGEGIEPVLKETVAKVLENCVRLTNPKFVGHMTGATTIFSVAVEMLTAVLNQNLNKIETALSASFVERQTVAWFHRLVYARDEKFYSKFLHDPAHLLGTVTSGGTMGNLTALTVARNLVLGDVARLGIAGALAKKKKKRAVIVASRRAHYSVRKVASVLGLGSDNVIEIPVAPFDNTVDVALLKTQVEKLEKQGAIVVAVVGVAGTTETGSIDDLVTLGKFCCAKKIWFHVDAAWGGALLLSERYKTLLRGIELSDSVVVDGHKFFYLPLDHGMVVFKNEKALHAIRHHANYIIREGSVDLGQTSLEGSRRFNSLKLWFALKALGRSGYGALIEHSLEIAKQTEKLISEHPEFELTSGVATNIITYRYVPRAWKSALAALRNQLMSQANVKNLTRKKDSAEIGKVTKIYFFVNSILNRVNTDLQKQQRQAGKSFVSRTTLESVTPGFETVVLRMIPFNPFTTVETIREILTEQAELGRALFASELAQCENEAPKGLQRIFPPL